MEQTVASFFYFLTLDEKKSAESLQRVLQYLDKTPIRNIDSTNRIQLIRVMAQVYQKENRGKRALYDLTKIKTPFARWSRFLSEANNNEAIAIVLCHLLHFPKQDVSQALGLDHKNLQQRLSMGLRHLGAVE